MKPTHPWGPWRSSHTAYTCLPSCSLAVICSPMWRVLCIWRLLFRLSSLSILHMPGWHHLFPWLQYNLPLITQNSAFLFLNCLTRFWCMALSQDTLHSLCLASFSCLLVTSHISQFTQRRQLHFSAIQWAPPGLISTSLYPSAPFSYFPGITCLS